MHARRKKQSEHSSAFSVVPRDKTGKLAVVDHVVNSFYGCVAGGVSPPRFCVCLVFGLHWMANDGDLHVSCGEIVHMKCSRAERVDG